MLAYGLNGIFPSVKEYFCINDQKESSKDLKISLAIQKIAPLKRRFFFEEKSIIQQITYLNTILINMVPSKVLEIGLANSTTLVK